MWLLFLAVILAAGLYFFTKEYFRIYGNNVSARHIIISGIFLGIFVLVNEAFINIDIQGIPISITVVFVFFLTAFVDRNLFIPITLAFFIAFGLNLRNTDFSLDKIIIILRFIIVAIAAYAITFSKKLSSQNYGTKLLIGLGVVALSATITSALISYINSQPIEIGRFYSAFAEVGLYIVLGFLVGIIEYIYVQYSRIETFTTLDDISFYKLSLAKEQLFNNIKYNSVSYGALFLFDLRKYASGTSNYETILIELKDKVSEKYDDAFFFKATPIFYSVFIPMKQSDVDIDYFKRNNRTIKNIKGVFQDFSKLLDDASLDHEIRAFGSIYGISHTSVDELIQQAEFLMSRKVISKNKSNVTIFDYTRLHKTYNTRATIQSLSNYTTGYKISLVKSLYDDSIYYPIWQWKNKDYTIKDAKKKLSSKRYNVLVRHYAYNVLSKFDNWDGGKIVIPYDLSIINDPEFKAEEFISKVSQYGNPKSIIVGFTKGEVTSKTTSKLKQLKESGIKIALLEAENSTITFANKLKPDYKMNSHREFSVKNLFTPAQSVEVNEKIEALEI